MNLTGQKITKTGLYTIYFIALVLLAFVMYMGKPLFVPMCYGLLVGVILYPPCRWLELHHVPRSLAIFTGLLIITLLIIGLVWLMIFQLDMLRNDLPVLKPKLIEAFSKIQIWVTGIFNEPVYFELTKLPGDLFINTGNAIASGIFTLFLIPIFAALFLYNRGNFISFLLRIAGPEYAERTKNALGSMVHTYSGFIKGMVMVYAIVGILNSIGLMILGIRYALLFGFLTAIMTIIPYVGIIVSAILPITVAWITKNNIWYPVGVVAIFAVVQYLEANVIFPKVVGVQLNISTWATLVFILAGGIIWGVSGMILFIPFAGMLKIFSDRFPGMEAINILLRRNNNNKLQE